MDNKISFKGISNVGAIQLKVINPDNMRFLKRKYLTLSINNDKYGNDLDDYKKCLEKCMPSRVFDFPHDNAILNIFTQSRSGKKYDVPKLFFNFYEIPRTRRMVPFFEYVAKLTRKIANLPDEKFHVSDSFKYGEAGDRYILGDSAVSELMPDPSIRKQALDHIYSPTGAKTGASLINADIQAAMEDYLL